MGWKFLGPLHIWHANSCVSTEQCILEQHSLLQSVMPSYRYVHEIETCFGLHVKAVAYARFSHGGVFNRIIQAVMQGGGGGFGESNTFFPSYIFSSSNFPSTGCRWDNFKHHWPLWQASKLLKKKKKKKIFSRNTKGGGGEKVFEPRNTLPCVRVCVKV